MPKIYTAVVLQGCQLTDTTTFAGTTLKQACDYVMSLEPLHVGSQPPQLYGRHGKKLGLLLAELLDKKTSVPAWGRTADGSAFLLDCVDLKE